MVPGWSTTFTAVVALVVGWAGWTGAEYILHRFAMHAAGGRGLVSREHLEHHVTPVWTVSARNLVPWAGIVLVGVVGWGPLGWVVAGPAAAVGAAAGWGVGYSFYFYQHMVAHLRGPRTRYQRFVHKLHLQHHFGSPSCNHSLSVPVWDWAFGTLEVPDRVRVPRRLAPTWMIGADGEVPAEHAADYLLVGARDLSERTVMIDRARAFAAQAPAV